MKNLENYSVSALSTSEVIKTEGGRPPSTLDSAVYISANIIHAASDFFAGAWDRLINTENKK